MNTLESQSPAMKFLRVLVDVGFWIGVLAMVIFVALVVFQLPMGSGGQKIVPNMQFDGFRIESSAAMQSQGNYTMLVSLVILMMVNGLIGVWYVRAMVHSLKDGTPFTFANAKRIRIIALVVLVGSYLRQIVVYQYVKAVAGVWVANASEVLIRPNFTLLPSGVLLDVCLFVLARIFSYGCQLQYEHDMTV